MSDSITKLLAKNKRIAILTPTLWNFSGIDRVVVQQVTELKAAGFQVTVFCLDQQMPLSCPIVELGLPTQSLWQRVYRLIGIPFNFWLLFKTLPQLVKYDVVIATQYPMTFLASFSRKFSRQEYIYWDYGIPPHRTFDTFIEQIYIILFTLATKLTTLTADRIVSISGFLEKEIRRYYQGPTHVVYPKVEVPKHAKTYEVQLKELRQKYSITSSTKTLLYLGRLSPHKGIATLIKACQSLSTSNWVLLLGGVPTFKGYYQQLLDLSKNDSRIKFIGFIPEEQLATYYSLTDIYVTASEWEGYNLPLVTAHTLGKKVVAFDVGAHSELIPRSALATYTGTTNENIDSLAKKLQSTLDK